MSDHLSSDQSDIGSRHGDEQEFEPVDEMDVQSNDSDGEVEEARMDTAEQEPRQSSILTLIQGRWRIVSSLNMPEFLDKWQPTDLFSAVYQLGQPHFDYDGRVLNMYEAVGIDKYFESSAQLGETVVCGRNDIKSMVENDQLVTVLLDCDNDEEYSRIERFMVGDQLHIVQKRFGLSCTRIYEKVDSGMRAEFERLVAERIELGEKVVCLLEQNKELNALVKKGTDEKAELQSEMEENMKKFGEWRERVDKKTAKNERVNSNLKHMFYISMTEREKLMEEVKELKAKLREKDGPLEPAVLDEMLTYEQAVEAAVGQWKLIPNPRAPLTPQLETVSISKGAHCLTVSLADGSIRLDAKMKRIHEKSDWALIDVKSNEEYMVLFHKNELIVSYRNGDVVGNYEKVVTNA